MLFCVLASLYVGCLLAHSDSLAVQALSLCRGVDDGPISAESPGVKSIQGSVGKTSPQSQGRAVCIPSNGTRFVYLNWNSKDFVFRKE